MIDVLAIGQEHIGKGGFVGGAPVLVVDCAKGGANDWFVVADQNGDPVSPPGGALTVLPTYGTYAAKGRTAG